MQTLIDCLRERGLIEAITSEDMEEVLRTPQRVYVGFDPTADSLHLGNLLGIVILSWFQRYGHTPVVILGGATGRIGDPSGKSLERPLLDSSLIAKNISRIRSHFEQVLDFSCLNCPMVLNNDLWLEGYSLISFLREIGKHFRVNAMLSKESVRSRLDSEEGISFTEFSYQLLQAYDFYYLFSQYGVSMQLGGSDQWGNITAGIELIRKMEGKAAFGLTFPLLTRSDGKKFGKTEEGAVWLAEDRFSPYQFYQYLVRLPDTDVIKLMRMLTFMRMEEILFYEGEMKKASYIPNTAQKRLAEELTRLVHGERGLESALRVTEGIAPGVKTVLDPEAFKEIARDLPPFIMRKEEVIGNKLVEVLMKLSLFSSKGELMRLIQNGGLYLNNDQVENVHLLLAHTHLIGDKYLLIGIGKKKKTLIQVEM